MNFCYGIISETDPAKGLVRVTFYEYDDGAGNALVSAWIQVIVRKSLQDKETFPYDANEHVACIMDEHFETGIVMGAVYNDSDLPDGAGADIHRVKYKDGSFIQFNRASGDYEVNVKGKVKLTAVSDVEVNSQAKVKVTNTGDVEVNSQGNVRVTTTQNIVMSAQNLNLTGDMAVTGNIQANGTIHGLTNVKAGIAPQVTLLTHTHIDPQGGVTGLPQ